MQKLIADWKLCLFCLLSFILFQKSPRQPNWTRGNIWLVTLVFHSAQQTDIHLDCTAMNRSRMDQYNPIRNTVSLGSKAHSELRNLTTRQYVNIEPSCSSDSSTPSFDSPPLLLPEYQQSFIVTARMQSISILCLWSITPQRQTHGACK